MTPEEERNARLDIGDVLSRFIDRLDARDIDGVLAEMHEDVVWTAEDVFRGREAVRRRLEGRPDSLRTFNIQSSSVITFAGPLRAEVRSHLAVYANDPAEGAESPMRLRLGAIYSDVLTRRNGLWRIAEKSIAPVGSWPA